MTFNEIIWAILLIVNAVAVIVDAYFNRKLSRTLRDSIRIDKELEASNAQLLKSLQEHAAQHGIGEEIRDDH